MRRRIRVSLAGAIVLGVACAASPVSAKLPPVAASAAPTTPLGAQAEVELWFVDRTGAALPAREMASWNLPEQVAGWMWAYPARGGRPDRAHPGIRIPLNWRDGRYRGSFVPDLPGPWLVIPFGANHRMSDPFGPAEAIEIVVGRVEGTAGTAPRGSSSPPTWAGVVLLAAIAGGLGAVLTRGTGSAAR